MARAKKTQAEPQGPTFDEVREPLAQFIEEVERWVNDATSDIENIVNTINSHAKAGNEISDRVDSLTVQVQSQRVLQQGLREDLKRLRTEHAFRAESLVSTLESIEDALDEEEELYRALRDRVLALEVEVFTQPPTLWERIVAFVRGEQ